MAQQNTAKPAPPAPAPVLGPGVQALQSLVSQSQQAPPAPGVPAQPPPPPPIRTDSIMGLLQSLKDRASYAMFGPSQLPATPPPVTPPK